jgi:hypothetical protein
MRRNSVTVRRSSVWCGVAQSGCDLALDRVRRSSVTVRRSSEWCGVAQLGCGLALDRVRRSPFRVCRSSEWCGVVQLGCGLALDRVRSSSGSNHWLPNPMKISLYSAKAMRKTTKVLERLESMDY